MSATDFRSRRTEKTRHRLLQAARQVFMEFGYDDARLDMIAEKAGVHVQTLYRHFDSKQDLASAGDRYYLDRFRQDLAAKPADVDTFMFWRTWLKQAVLELTEDGGEAYRGHLALRHASPSLLGATWIIHAAYEDLLTGSLARDFDMEADGIGIPRLVAGMLLAGNAHVIYSYEQKNGELLEESMRVIDVTEELFSDLVRRR